MQTIKRVIPGLILVTALLSGGGGAYGAQERQANSTTLRDKPLVTDRIQMIAGESRSALRETGAVSLASVISSRTTPPLSFPIRVEIVEVSGAPQLQVTTPPATPAGEYTVDLTAPDQIGLQGRLAAPGSPSYLHSFSDNLALAISKNDRKICLQGN